jgi:hypothetical protein
MKRIATIKMYYCDTNTDDSENYECNEHYFFPFLSLNEHCENKTTDIDFELMVYKNELLWAQKNERIITSLEPECGEQLLQMMNEAYCVNAVKILSSIGNVLYPKKEKFD